MSWCTHSDSRLLLFLQCSLKMYPWLQMWSLMWMRVDFSDCSQQGVLVKSCCLQPHCVLRVFMWSAEPKDPTEQPHGRPLDPERAAQPDDIGRELPQRAGAQGTQPHVFRLAAQPGAAGPLPGLPGPLSGCIQAPPQPQLSGQLQPRLQTPTLSDIPSSHHHQGPKRPRVPN